MAVFCPDHRLLESRSLAGFPGSKGLDGESLPRWDLLRHRGHGDQIRTRHGLQCGSGLVFFADNKGGGNATEELNILQVGQFYGHNPRKYEGKFDVAVPPVFSLEHELAPSGLEFNSLENDFGGSAGSLFVAFYGPSERWNRGGVARVTIQKTSVGYEYKELPVVDIPKLSDLTFGKDGSLYLAQHGISDYWYNPTEVKTGGFYKLIHDPSREGKHLTKREIKEESFPEASLEKGRELFALRACSACHSIDGETDLIGPNLNGVGREFSQEELLEEINAPPTGSKRA